jgi:hypothetical protein
MTYLPRLPASRPPTIPGNGCTRTIRADENVTSRTDAVRR